jgi:hypothetical protein
MYDTVINYTQHTNSLGLWLDKNLKWSTHTQQLANKLCKVCFVLRVIKRVSGLETVCTLYYAYFHSLLLYGLIFWGNLGNAKLIFRLQKRAIRAMVQIPNNISCKQYFKSLHILPAESHEQLFLHATWEQQTKQSTVVGGNSWYVNLQCLVTSIACVT